jgi:hypothetical protein
MLRSQIVGGIFVIFLVIIIISRIRCWATSRGGRKQRRQGRTGKMQVYK